MRMMSSIFLFVFVTASVGAEEVYPPKGEKSEFVLLQVLEELKKTNKKLDETNMNLKIIVEQLEAQKKRDEKKASAISDLKDNMNQDGVMNMLNNMKGMINQ